MDFVKLITLFIWSFSGFSLISYFISSIALTVIGNNKGVPYYGLSWLPGVGASYVLGSIADGYTDIRRGKSKYLKIFLPIASLIVFVSGFIILFSMMLMEAHSDTWLPLGAYFSVFIGLIVGLGLLVFTYYAHFVVFANTVPERAVLYLVLTILLFFMGPILLFAIRNKTNQNNFLNSHPKRR